VACALALGACRPAPTSQPTPAPLLPAATATAEPTAAPQPTATQTALHPVLPDLEAGVETIFALAPTGDWNAVAAEVDRMSQAWYAHGLEVSLAGATQSTLNWLDESLYNLANATAAQDETGTLQAANLVSAAVADLYDLYLPPPSGDLRRLAMLERQLWIDAALGDPKVIEGDYAQMRAIWDRIAPQIREEGGAAFADQFEASLAAQLGLIQANDPAGLRAEIGHGIELVTLLR
jgi:hypothetical protein